MLIINLLTALLFITCNNGQTTSDISDSTIAISARLTTPYPAGRKVKTRTNWRTKYRSNGQMNIEPLKGIVNNYDSSGNIVKSFQFTDEGKPYKHEWFEYDKTGKMVKATVSYLHDDFVKIELLLKHDNQDRVTEMKISHPMDSYWYKETISYDKNGNVSEKKWWKDEDTLFHSVNRAEYIYKNGLQVKEIGYKTDDIFVTVKNYYDAQNQLAESHYYGYGKVQELYMISRYEYEYY